MTRLIRSPWLWLGERYAAKYVAARIRPTRETATCVVIDSRVSNSSTSVELQLFALAVGVTVQEREHAEHRGPAERVGQHQERRVLVLEDVRHRRVGEAGVHQQPLHDRREHELERIDEEENHEQQHGVERDRGVVLEPVAAKEDELRPPDEKQQAEGDREREEAAHRVQHLVGGLRHLERHDEQRDREAENGVAQPFDARDLLAANPKIAITHSQMMRPGARPPQPPFGPRRSRQPDRPSRSSSSRTRSGIVSAAISSATPSAGIPYVTSNGASRSTAPCGTPGQRETQRDRRSPRSPRATTSGAQRRRAARETRCPSSQRDRRRHLERRYRRAAARTR